MVYTRKSYELEGIDVAYADLNLSKLVDFEPEKRVCFPGMCKPEFNYRKGVLKTDKNVQISFFRKKNKGRIVLRYDTDLTDSVDISSRINYERQTKEQEESYWKRVKKNLEGMFSGIKVSDPSVFSENQMVF